MQIQVTQSSNADTRIVYALKDTPIAGDDSAQVALQPIMEAGDFSGDVEQVAVLYQTGNALERVITVGLGNPDELTAETLRRATAAAFLKVRSLKVAHVAVILSSVGDAIPPETAATAVIEGARLALYRYDALKTSDEETTPLPESVDVVTTEAHTDGVSAGIATGNNNANGTILARDLANTPPNICTPAYLAEQARMMAAEVGLTCTILDPAQIAAEKMGLLLAVARASEDEPRFIILEHNADLEGDTIVLAGKGVTFDTGGYNLKSNMGNMKGDMGGGAAVIGAMRIIAERKLPVHVVGLIPTSDNMISGRGFRQEEVITASNGKTVEIGNTDAEGRLLLADALVYAKRYNPSVVVDIATLTGAITAVLGSGAAGVYAIDDRSVAALNAAAEVVHEPIWRMPFYPKFDKLLKSNVADITNIGAVRSAGSSTAAAFLKFFTDYPAWAHIDMAGMMSSQSDSPVIPTGMTGYGARLLAEFVNHWGQTDA